MSAHKTVSCRTMQFIISEDLGFLSLSQKKVQSLPAAQIIKKLLQCKKFLILNGSKSVDKIIFYDEKLFCIEQIYSVKNGAVHTTTSIIYVKVFEL